LVFPLGMYAVCTFEMVRAMSLDFLLPIAHVFAYAALLAWGATFVGLIHSLVSSLIQRPERSIAEGRT
jgi:tellurite resistance protein TehA-like permease